MSDPTAEVKKSVLRWHFETLTFPTWQEVLEFEYLRRFGNINMFIVGDVIAACVKHGLLDALHWFERTKSVKAIPSSIFGLAVKHYQTHHGSQDTWLTSEIINELLSRHSE